MVSTGLADLRMPPPGRSGHATIHHASAIRADHRYAGAFEFAPLAGRVAMMQEDIRQNVRVVLAGAHSPVFNPGARVNINAMASGSAGLWITTGPSRASTGTVILLNDRLQTVTPRSISQNPALAFPEQVRTAGDTVLVTTDSSSHPLVCFRFHNGQAGPVADIPARLPPGDVTMADHTVYATDAQGVIVYRLPAACL